MRRLMLLAMIVIGVSLPFAGFTYFANQHDEIRTTHKICVALNHLNGVITAQLQRSKVNLPKLIYFRDHPDELATQIAEINHSLTVFKVNPCK